MSSISTDSLHSRVSRSLAPHGSNGVRTALSGVVDLEDLEEQRYEDVLHAVDQRLSQSRYTLLSMVVAGIYFGLLVGVWLVDGSTWEAVTLWTVPVLLVMTYGLYAAYQTIVQIRRLAEARALLHVLAQQAAREEDAKNA